MLSASRCDHFIAEKGFWSQCHIYDQVGCWLLVVGCCWLVHRKRKLRIQGRMQIFEKMSQMALNHDLRPELESRGKMLQIPLKIMDLGAFCVEL